MSSMSDSRTSAAASQPGPVKARAQAYYLEPTFDPTKATVPELKSILLDCGVSFPTHRALKDEFVSLFRENVAANAASISAARARVRPSSSGIHQVRLSPLLPRKRDSDENSNHALNNSNNNNNNNNNNNTIADQNKRQKALPPSLPIPPANPQTLLHPPRQDLLADLPPPMYSSKQRQPSLSVKSQSRLPKPSKSASSSPNASISSARSSINFNPILEGINFTNSPEVMSSCGASEVNASLDKGEDVQERDNSIVAESVLGDEDEQSFQRMGDDEDEGAVDSDYSDVLDAYEASSVAREEPLDCPKTPTAATGYDSDEEDIRFSPDPRRSSSSNHRSISPRNSTGTPALSTGSPLLTQTLKQRLRKQVMETVRRRSSLGGDEITRGRKLSLTDTIKAVESDFYSENEDGPDEDGSFFEPATDIPDPNEFYAQDAAEGSGKPVRFMFPCFALICYILLVPPLFMLVTWYLETGSSIQFCGSITEPRLQLAEVVTARDLMNYMMPSCINCPQGVICQEDRVVGCIFNGKNVYFSAPKPFRFAFQLGTSFCEAEYNQNEKQEHISVSMQQPSYHRTEAPKPEPTVTSAQRQKEYFDRIIPIVKNVTMETEASLRKLLSDFLVQGESMSKEVYVTWKEVSSVVSRETVVYWSIANNHIQTLARNYNKTLTELARVVTPHPDELLTYSTWTICVSTLLFLTTTVTRSILRRKKESSVLEDTKLAQEAAEEVIQKLRERAAKIRRQSKFIDTSVRIDQVRDLVLPLNPTRQRRASRGGDVDNSAALEGVMLLGEERREEVWKLVKQFVVESGEVEEMEVDGVAVWIMS